MEHTIDFHFRGKLYAATVYLSLQEDGCYIFAFFKDKDLITEFGSDVDIHTDCMEVLPDKVTNDHVTALKTAILEAVKKLPQFQEQKSPKLIITSDRVL